MTHLDMSEVLDFVCFIWKTICICICICMIIELLMGFMTMWLKKKAQAVLVCFGLIYITERKRSSFTG
jgi:uncharacterized membrane protein